jgi:hypothetical protein
LTVFDLGRFLNFFRQAREGTLRKPFIDKRSFGLLRVLGGKNSFNGFSNDLKLPDYTIL